LCCACSAVGGRGLEKLFRLRYIQPPPAPTPTGPSSIGVSPPSRVLRSPREEFFMANFQPPMNEPRLSFFFVSGAGAGDVSRMDVDEDECVDDLVGSTIGSSAVTAWKPNSSPTGLLSEGADSAGSCCPRCCSHGCSWGCSGGGGGGGEDKGRGVEGAVFGVGGADSDEDDGRSGCGDLDNDRGRVFLPGCFGESGGRSGASFQSIES